LSSEEQELDQGGDHENAQNEDDEACHAMPHIPPDII
jgi:hypothetical protein